MDRPPLPPRNSTLSSSLSSSTTTDAVSSWAPPVPLSSKPQSWQGKPDTALVKPAIPSRANSEYMHSTPLPSFIPLSHSVSVPPAQATSSSALASSSTSSLSEASALERVDAAPPLPKRPRQQHPAGLQSPAIPPHLTRASSGSYYVTSQPPSSILTEVSGGYFVCDGCPGAEPLRFDAFWFRHLDVPHFSICSYCFEFHIRGTTFESSFQCNFEPGESSAAWCMFGVPRMTELLWPLAKATSDLESVKAYMEHRLKLPSCHGLAGVTGPASEGLNWFRPEDDAIPNFFACAACYEEYIVGTDFEQCFVAHSNLQPHTDTWACDIAIPFLKKALVTYSSTNNWPAFITAATRRLALPACAAMSLVKSSTRRWYGVTAGKPGLGICEQCYLDRVVFSAFEADFQSSPLQQGEEDLDRICDLAIFPVKVSFELASAWGNPDCFWDTCRVQSTTAVCEKNDLVDVQWHTLKNGCDNFDICPACYKGVVCSAGMEDLFQPQKQTSQGVAKTCDFSSRAPRFSRYMLHYNLAMHTPNKETFTTFVKNISSMPLCHGVNFHKARFYSIKLDDDPMHVCQSCYHEVIADCALKDHFTLSDEIEEHICEMYSRNMRTRWMTVCESSVKDSDGQILPSQSALVEFVVYRCRRLNIYMQTVPVMQQIINMAKMRLMQQQRLNAQSSFYLGLEGLASAARGPTAYKKIYGNSSLGYHWDTHWGVESAHYGAQAQAIANSGGGDMAKVAYLERLWKEVE